MIELLNNVADRWFAWELAVFWQVAVLIAVVWLIDLSIRKWAWPQVRYGLWLLVLLKLILPPALTSPASITANIPSLFQKTVNVQTNRPETTPEVFKAARPPESGAQNLVQYPQTSSEPAPGNITPVQGQTSHSQEPLSLKAYAFFLYLAGVLILTIWVKFRLSSLYRKHVKGEKQEDLPERFKDLLEVNAKKLNLKKPPRVIVTDKVSCPAVFGVFRPVLLIPAGKLESLTAQHAEHILLHELAHVKRGDLFVHAVQMALQIAYWFNPLVWLTRKHLHRLRELCCDATVSHILEDETWSYRETLIETSRRLLAEPLNPGLRLMGLFENPNSVVERIRWLEKAPWKHCRLRRATVFVAGALMLGCVLPMGKADESPKTSGTPAEARKLPEKDVTAPGPSRVQKQYALKWVERDTGQKLFGVSDIVRFDWKKQIFELTRRGAMDLLGMQTGLHRKFALTDGKETIYEGNLVSISSTGRYRGPVIVFPSNDRVKPPLFAIQNGYRGQTAKTDRDLRFSRRLKKALQRADVLSRIDLNDPPPAIERTEAGWFGESGGLKVLVEVFPETFRFGRQFRMHVHLRPSSDLDENHVVGVNAALVSNRGKNKLSTQETFAFTEPAEEHIYPLKMKPSPWEEANQSRGEVKWGPAKLSAEVFVRKIHDRETETYSEPIGQVKTGAIDVFVQSGLPLLPEKLNILVLRFQNAIKQSDWDRALKYCSKKIKSEAEQYDSKEDFFKEVVPVKEIAGLAEFGISTTRSRNHQVVRYGCHIKLQYPEGRHSLSWDLSVLKGEPGWVIDFPVKPLDVWTKHQVLKQKEGQIDPQKSRSGFDVRLIPLTEEFVIGSPMLFRVEMKNTTNETLGYTDQPFMVDDPMVIKDPTGRNVPYMGLYSQIGIGKEFVEPGHTVLLADNYDARSHYHIVKPGKYTFQFKARHNRTISSSNCVEVGIKPGKLSALESIVERLMPVLPEGFELRRQVMSSNEVAEQGGEAIWVSLIGRVGKAEPQRAQVVRVVVLLDTDHSKVKIRRDYRPGLKFWGESEWGPVYLKAVKAVNVEQAWPEYKEQIRNALGI